MNASGRQEGASGKQDSLSEQEKSFSPYIIHEITIPNPDVALADKLPDGAWVKGTKYQLWKENTCELCCQIPETIVGSSFFADGERIYRYTRAGTDIDVSE